jgi:hypothetical protein
MAIGPERKDEVFKTSNVEKASYIAKKTLTAFFANPIEVIFYSSLSGLILGLLFKQAFTWPLYGIIAGLGFILFMKWLAPKAPID